MCSTVGLWIVHYVCNCGPMDSTLYMTVGLWIVHYVCNYGPMDSALCV